jgi:hypothetical protein
VIRVQVGVVLVFGFDQSFLHVFDQCTNCVECSWETVESNRLGDLYEVSDMCLVHVFGLPPALRSTSSIVPLQVDDGSLLLKSRCRVNKPGSTHLQFVKKHCGAKPQSYHRPDDKEHSNKNTNIQHIRSKSVRYIAQNPPTNQNSASNHKSELHKPKSPNACSLHTRYQHSHHNVRRKSFPIARRRRESDWAGESDARGAAA